MESTSDTLVELQYVGEQWRKHRWFRSVHHVAPTGWNARISPIQSFGNRGAPTVCWALGVQRQQRRTQPHPLTQRLPKIITSSQTRQNTPLDMVLPT